VFDDGPHLRALPSGCAPGEGSWRLVRRSLRDRRASSRSRARLDAHENEPTCAQSSGLTECAGMIRCDMRELGRKRNALQI
jgi:hypothetical protein